MDNFKDLDNFEKKLEEIRKRLDELDFAREELLKLSRELRRKATLAISNIHTGNISQAENILWEAKKILESIKAYQRYEISYPITREPVQELVEAYVFLGIVSKKKLEIPEFYAEIHPSSLLTGIADVVGELRRYVLDLMRKSQIKEAERLIQFMEKIYYSLISFNYPDKVVPGLRGKIDMIRLSLERTKSDLISAMVLERVIK